MKPFYLPSLQAFAISLLAAINFPVYAEAPLELATERGCLICHFVKHDPSKKIKLAPSYEEIAARYDNNADDADYLIGRVLDGTVKGRQNWKGEVNMRFMPPNVNVSRIEASEMVNWILGIKDRDIDPKLVKHEQMLGLAISSGCTACHAINKNQDRRYVPLAPAYREIAKKYKTDKSVRNQLIDSVLHGTVNKDKKWQNVNMRFMPPSLALSKENAEKLVDWILAL